MDSSVASGVNQQSPSFPVTAAASLVSLAAHAIMKFFLSLSLLVLSIASTTNAEDHDALTCFELRTYHATEGKLEDLHARFRDHTLTIFSKHGITNLAYWVPADNPDNLLIYLVGYKNKEARKNAWKDFRNDPDWKAAYKKSTENGKLVAKVDSLFLHLTDYSPAVAPELVSPQRLFEMREYRTPEGKLKNLDARFRDHTVELFSKHGISNLYYFHLDEGQPGAETTLLYFVAHESEESRANGFKAFGQDERWKKAREESVKDGPILVKKGITSTMLIPTDYSPTR